MEVMLEQETTILNYTAAINDINLQLLQNSEHLGLLQKQSAGEVADIKAQYTSEENYIKNEMKEATNSNAISQEYKDLLKRECEERIEELENRKDDEITSVETPVHIKETDIETQNSSLETRCDAMVEDRDALKENLKEDIENSFGYFNE